MAIPNMPFIWESTSPLSLIKSAGTGLFLLCPKAAQQRYLIQTNRTMPFHQTRPLLTVRLVKALFTHRFRRCRVQNIEDRLHPKTVAIEHQAVDYLKRLVNRVVGWLSFSEYWAPNFKLVSDKLIRNSVL